MLSLGHPAPKLEAEFWRMRWVWGNRCQYLPWLRKPLRAPSSGNMARTHIETTVPRRIKSQSERPLCLCLLQYSSMNGWMRSESRLGVGRQVMLLFSFADHNFRHLDGSLNVLKYHGVKRKELVLPHIQDADIVLTTYNTLVAEFGSKASPLHRLNWYRVVLDEGRNL